MKKLSVFFSVITLILVFTLHPVSIASGKSAPTNLISINLETFDDGSCYVTTIDNVPSAGIHLLAVKTETKSKTAYFKNSAGKVMWYVRVTGTFTYKDGTSKCISATPSAASLNANWKV